MTTPNGPNIADFSTHFSGPMASRHLAALGANVIKVENPKWGDGNRTLPPCLKGEGIHHLFLNAGTRSLAIDSRSKQWPRLIESIADWADVVIVGNRPANALRLGLDYPSLSRHNPRLIYCLITGYGLAGDWSEFPAHGLNMDALAGTVPLTQEDGRLDVPEHFRSLGTTMAGIQAAMGIYAALYKREKTGLGQVVQTSVWESALACMWRDVTTHANLHHAWTAYSQMGSRYCVYRASDGLALLVCPMEKHFWQRFCDVLGLPPDVKARGDWQGGSDLGEKYIRLGERELIQSIIETRPRQFWFERLTAEDVPAAPIIDWREAMASEHAQANGVMTEYLYQDTKVSLPTIPLSVTPATLLESGLPDDLARMHRRKAQHQSRAPYLGEHNGDICKELGLPQTFTDDILAGTGPAPASSP